MKRLIALSFLGSSLLIGSNSVKADENYVFTYNDTTGLYELYKVTTNGASQSFSLITTKNADVVDMRDGWFDASQNKFYFQEYSSSNPTTNFQVYNLKNSSWSTQAITNTNDPFPHHNQIATYNRATITTNASNISSNDTDIATNASNISSNTSNIKNLGQGVAGSTALTAALTALPQTSKDSKLSCGIGTGAYSSRYAVGFGCASKVNERVDVNAGGSYVFGGSKSYGEGTLDSGVVKAGFVFKLGELKKPTQISMKEKKELKQEISILKENNQNILAQNQALLARLERLEKIALGESKSKDLAVYQLK